MECLNPPLEQPPPGIWHCPRCPPLTDNFSTPATAITAEPPTEPTDVEFMVTCPVPTAMRESSVASSSKSSGVNGAVKGRRKGKARAVATDDSEVDLDEAGPPSRSTRRKSLARLKLATDALLKSEAEPELEPEETAPANTGRPSKRMRVRLTSPAPPLKPPTIRLRLPPRVKGKERADDPDDSKKGMFDDLLPPEDRDTTATNIAQVDKQRFEKSRAAADVRTQLSHIRASYSTAF